MRWKKVTLVGVGLLGGSLGKALRQRRLADSVIGFVRRAASVKECQTAGAVDLATRDLSSAVEGADLVVLCTPIAQMEPLVRQMLPALRRRAIVTDVGSVKASLVRQLEKPIARAGAYFVGSHPMAGAEKMGVAAAHSRLFESAICIVTPTPNSHRAAVRHIEQLWRSVGSRVVRLAPKTHDQLVSRSSHLPHVVAAELSNYVLGHNQPGPQELLCANGFRDTTRIASGSPEMWRDIALANRDHLLEALGGFLEQLQNFKRLLKRGDAKAISAFFEDAKQRRDRWARKMGSPSPE
ncbi:MAG TPA: prephenate dehydrogenase/arogenate dehydrogenase family protein [Candidatus Limnocylindrales bacterium]|nr:prephenate dehydrogenase/arogenate dehydrogenase family protein [Candidatus Limnocylindrales bacterium]